MSTLTSTERATLLEPCVCGHSINDHGSLIPCWTCEDEGRSCELYFEELLCARVAVIVEGRVVPVRETLLPWTACDGRPCQFCASEEGA